MFLALSAFIASKLVSAYRLNNFYNAKGLKLSTPLNIKLYMLAMYYSLFIPGVGGDGFKVYWLNKRYGFEIKKSIWITFMDRLSGLVALSSLSIIFFLFSSLSVSYKWWSIALIPLGYLFFYLILRFFSRDLLSVYFITSIQSFIVQLLQVVCVWLVIYALGINESINEYIFIFLISCLAFIIPVFGVREAAFVFGAKWLGLNPELTAAISMLFYCCLALTSLSGIYYFFIPGKLNPEQGNYENVISTLQD